MGEDTNEDRHNRVTKLFFADLEQLLSRFDEFENPEWKQIATTHAEGVKAVLFSALQEGKFRS